VPLNIAQNLCDRDTAAVLVLYGAQKYGRYPCELRDLWCCGRLSFSILEDLHYVQKADGQYPIAFREIVSSLGVGGQQKEKYDDLELCNFGIFLFIF
jgi:hypothetical protein